MANQRAKRMSGSPPPTGARPPHPLAWIVRRPHQPSLVVVAVAIMAFVVMMAALFSAFTALGFGMDAMRLRAADSYGSSR